jgi:hypothetical protein
MCISLRNKRIRTKIAIPEGIAHIVLIYTTKYMDGMFYTDICMCVCAILFRDFAFYLTINSIPK